MISVFNRKHQTEHENCYFDCESYLFILCHSVTFIELTIWRYFQINLLFEQFNPKIRYPEFWNGLTKLAKKNIWNFEIKKKAMVWSNFNQQNDYLECQTLQIKFQSIRGPNVVTNVCKYHNSNVKNLFHFFIYGNHWSKCVLTNYETRILNLNILKLKISLKLQKKNTMINRKRQKELNWQNDHKKNSLIHLLSKNLWYIALFLHFWLENKTKQTK